MFILRLNCPACNSLFSKLWSCTKYMRFDVPIYVCNQCGTHYSGYVLDKDALAEMYSRNYFEENSLYFSSSTDFEINLWKSIISEYFLKYKNKNYSDLSVLDVGCGGGLFLEFMKTSGLKKGVGLDISPDIILAAKQKTNFEVISGELVMPEVQSKLKSLYPLGFDIITLFDVLEHCNDPRSVLKNAYDLLSDNGVLVFTTVNVSSLIYKLGYLLHSLPVNFIKRIVLHYLYPMYHVQYWSYDGICVLLKSAGFEILSFRTLPYELQRMDKANSKIKKIIVYLIQKVCAIFCLNQSETNWLFICRRK